MNASKLWPSLIALCVACGSSFQASDGATAGGAGGTGGSGSVGNGSGAGTTSAGGSSGAVGSAGSSSHGGGSVGGASGGSDSGGTGATGASAGTDATAGSSARGGGDTGGSIGTSGSGGDTGGSIGTSGSGGSLGTSGSAGSGGAGGTPDCATLQSTYYADLAKAKVCDPSVKAQCSTSSTLPGSCGCAVLVAAGTAATSKAKADYQAFTDAGCSMVVCPVACLFYSGATCALDSSSGGHMCAGSP